MKIPKTRQTWVYRTFSDKDREDRVLDFGREKG